MEEQSPKIKESIIAHWTQNLVGSPVLYAMNLVISLAGGVLYSFGIWPSPFGLAVFGVLLPMVFTLCLYSFICGKDMEAINLPIPKRLTDQKNCRTLKIMDIGIIVVLALLIYEGTLNFLFIRILQTMLLPSMALVLLRTLYKEVTQAKG